MGIKGLVIKGAATRYVPGGAATRYVPGRATSWLKWKARVTEEVMVGAITESLQRAEALIVGRLTPNGQLVVVGRSAALTAAQAEQLGSVLTPLDSVRHPWPEQIGSFFGGPPVILRHVGPVLVAEISADAALQGGRCRHAVRFVRLRPKLHPADLSAWPDNG